MTEPKADWYQTCENCGTQLAGEFSYICDETYICPWCGALMHIESDSLKIPNEQPETKIPIPTKTISL